MEPAEPITVTVLNETDRPIDVERWAGLVNEVLASEGVTSPAETNVVFVDEAAMSDLNEEHMGHEGPTDVLSFPIDDEDADSGHPLESPVRFVGDIVICPEVAARNAPDHAGTFDDEIALLLVHGSLHLLGHDHAEPDERRRMWAAEQRLLAAHWGALSADPWAASDDDDQERAR